MALLTVDIDDITHAAANLSALLNEALEEVPMEVTIDRVAATRIEGDVAREALASNRELFTAAFQLSDKPEIAITIAMPDRPIREVAYGLGQEDQLWEFPKLQVNDRSLWWPFAIQLIRETLVDAYATTPRSLLDYDIVSAQRSACGLGFGYNAGLPDEPFTAAWGCRAIVHQAGHVDLVHDRQSTVGEDKAVDALLGKLDGGLTRKWTDTAVGMLRGYEMSVGQDLEHLLLDEDGVTVKAIPRGGYLYVCAYTAQAADRPAASAGS